MAIPPKYRFHIIGLIAVAIMILYPLLSTKVEPRILLEGTTAAENFLQLVDADQYEQSWNAASPLIKDKIFLEVWNRKLLALRSKTGPLLTRTQKEASVSEFAEGAPDGQYLTLIYNSSFANQAEAVETVILALGSDEKWRVAGYFLK